VKAWVAGALLLALLVKLGDPVEVTLWVSAPPAQVQVTVPLTATVSTAGLTLPFRSLRKLSFRTVTPMVLGVGVGTTDVASVLLCTWRTQEKGFYPATGPERRVSPVVDHTVLDDHLDIRQRLDVEQRIPLQHDDVGQLARLDRAEVVSSSENARADAGGCRDRPLRL